MGKLDFLYRMELPHRAVAVYIYLSDRANQEGEGWLKRNSGTAHRTKGGNCGLLVTGEICHHDRRKGTSHSKILKRVT